VRRRAFVTALGGAALLALAGHAQQTERVPRVGALMPYRENDPRTQQYVRAFGQALAGFGWVEGANIRIDYRFAAGDPALFKTYAAELVGMSPIAILASTTAAVLALRQETRTIPIVFLLVADAVGLGFVKSLARPGGNLTGFNYYDAGLMGKWLELLKEAAPGVTRVAVIVNPDTLPSANVYYRPIEAAAPSFKVTVTFAPVHDDAGIEQVIAAQGREPGGGLICLPDSFTAAHGDVIIAAAARHSLPLIGVNNSRAGGLMSYWFDAVDLHAQAACYIDRILKGASPADLPVQQPTKFLLFINLKTAKALDLTVPPTLLDLADEVIE
jgi:putative ABC transport system substrate-binding protein